MRLHIFCWSESLSANPLTEHGITVRALCKVDCTVRGPLFPEYGTVTRSTACHRRALLAHPTFRGRGDLFCHLPTFHFLKPRFQGGGPQTSAMVRVSHFHDSDGLSELGWLGKFSSLVVNTVFIHTYNLL